MQPLYFILLIASLTIVSLSLEQEEKVSELPFKLLKELHEALEGKIKHQMKYPPQPVKPTVKPTMKTDTDDSSDSDSEEYVLFRELFQTLKNLFKSENIKYQKLQLLDKIRRKFSWGPKTVQTTKKTTTTSKTPEKPLRGWASAKDGNIPYKERAVLAGYDEYHGKISKVFVSRSYMWQDGRWIPIAGHLREGDSCGRFTWGNSTFCFRDYQVLIGPGYFWSPYAFHLTSPYSVSGCVEQINHEPVSSTWENISGWFTSIFGGTSGVSQQPHTDIRHSVVKICKWEHSNKIIVGTVAKDSGVCKGEFKGHQISSDTFSTLCDWR